VAQNINDVIARRIQEFAKELEALVRQAALDAVASSFGGSAPRAAAPLAKPAAKASAKAASSGGTRAPELLASHVSKAADWIMANPGHGVEDMAKALGLETKDLALPIQKLLKAKTITRRGVKRATKYFPKK
jgi:N-acetylmuramoyl-L-alanine amidase